MRAGREASRSHASPQGQLMKTELFYIPGPWSGKGLTRNYERRDVLTLPELYQRVIPTEDSSPAIPNVRADVVVVNTTHYAVALRYDERADVAPVVVAKGVAKDAYNATVAAGGMHSGQGNVVARLIRVKDGKVLASSTQHAAQVHIDLDTARLNALNEAARLAAAELSKKISE